MELKDQVCTLKQAKKLSKLGILQGCSFAAWLKNTCHKETDFWPWPVLGQGVDNRGYEVHDKGCLIGYSAFTVAELGLILPGMNISRGQFCHFSKGDTSNDWSVDISFEDCPGLPEKFIKLEKEHSEAEVRAAVLIYLIEKEYVRVEDINGRLKKTESS